MIRTKLSLGAAIVAAGFTVGRPTASLAQTDSRSDVERIGGVPREVAREVIGVWNARGTRKVPGGFSLPAGDTVRGDLAILEGGRSRIAGVVLGQVVVINGDLRLAATSRIGGNVTIVGGELEYDGDSLNVGGEARVWSSRIRYREEADTLVAEDRDTFSRLARFGRDDGGRTRSELFAASAHTYNRVEGFPLYLGPRVETRFSDTRISVQLLGIFRTGNRLVWERENLGHSARAEVRKGRRGGFSVGGRLFDEVDAVEHWQLTAGEVGLATFLFSRDYRDYWQRHGASAYASLFARRGTELRVEYGEERWSSRRARNVPSVIDNDVPFRLNPAMDEGVVHLLTVGGTLDTRNDRDDPRSGWLLAGEWEHGDGVLDRIAPTTSTVRAQAPGEIAYSRGFVDLRRYNRLGPVAQLNLRAVLGGWLDGDPLPLQRRFSVSGVDALPGYEFRRVENNADVGTCATGTDAEYAALGRPAQCERMLLLQAEWKGNFRVRLFGDRDRIGDRRYGASRFNADGTWVIFANSGRGWLLGDRGTLGAGTGRVPDTGTWRTDLGLGVDLGGIGVYVAQAVSEQGHSPQLFVRLNHRF